MSANPTENTDTTNRAEDERLAGPVALVTGATSGLGFAAAAQLPERGYRRIIVTGRTAARAEAARRRLVEQTGRDQFEALALDLSKPASVQAAVRQLADGLQPTGGRMTVDYLLANAGMVSGQGREITDAGVELTFASSLVGHHQLTMGLLDRDLLASRARIVIAGSEAARGDLPTFTPTDLAALAGKHYRGDLEAAAEALIRGTAPGRYKPGNTYADTKLFVAWWAAALARRLPAGMAVNAVSPGSAPDTAADRNMNFFMKRIMVPVMKAMPKRLGMAADTPTAAARYLDVAEYPADVSGEFFASAPKKVTGPLHRVELDHVHVEANQEAAWRALTRVAAAPMPERIGSAG